MCKFWMEKRFYYFYFFAHSILFGIALSSHVQVLCFGGGPSARTTLYLSLCHTEYIYTHNYKITIVTNGFSPQSKFLSSENLFYVTFAFFLVIYPIIVACLTQLQVLFFCFSLVPEGIDA